MVRVAHRRLQKTAAASPPRDSRMMTPWRAQRPSLKTALYPTPSTHASTPRAHHPTRSTHLPILACQLGQRLFERPFPHAHAFEFGHAPFVFALGTLEDEVQVLVFFFEGMDRFEGGTGGELGLKGEDGGLELPRGGQRGGGPRRRAHAHLVVFAVLFEELSAEGVFDGRRLVGFTEDAEVGVVGACGAEGEGCAGVGADALGAAHCWWLRVWRDTSGGGRERGGDWHAVALQARCGGGGGGAQGCRSRPNNWPVALFLASSTHIGYLTLSRRAGVSIVYHTKVGYLRSCRASNSGNLVFFGRRDEQVGDPKKKEAIKIIGTKG